MDCDLNTLADSYLRHNATRSDAEFWAWQRVGEIVRSGDLDRAWEITLLLLRKAPYDVLGYIAAGPLEDFIDGYGDQGLDRAEQAGDEDPRLQYALSGIWLMPDSPVLRRWQGLMTKYGFRNGNRKPLSYGPPVWPRSKLRLNLTRKNHGIIAPWPTM
jgi:hypothetical protein